MLDWENLLNSERRKAKKPQTQKAEKPFARVKLQPSLWATHND